MLRHELFPRVRPCLPAILPLLSATRCKLRPLLHTWQMTMDHEHPAVHALPALRPLRVFSYTVESQSALYRSIVRVFAEAKARYRIQMRGEEILPELGRLGAGHLVPADGLDRALDQLVDWGNLRRSHDTGRVATLEDFRRRHFVYQLTPAGEAAERAVAMVVAALESSGSLQTVMLSAILRNLRILIAELEAPEPSPARLFEGLFNVSEQFRALAENASTFLAGLHAAIDAGEVHAEAFILYKQAVIEYLERFLSELAGLAPQITRALEQIEGMGVTRLVELAARADQAPTLGAVQDPSETLRRRWAGVRAWFLGEGHERPTVELLRGAALAAINRILLVLERLHEKRFRRVNRTADLLRLAGWFEALGARADEEGAHRLYQAAFSLHGARHFGGLHEDPERVRPGTSWWRAEPVPIAPSLRQTGRNTATGRPAQVADHSREKRYLAERHQRERAAFLSALERFAGRGPLNLGELPLLTDAEFKLLLQLLDRLLCRRPRPGGQWQARSRDGRLALRLDPPRPGVLAVLRTRAGALTLPAFTLTVSDLATGPPMAVRQPSAPVWETAVP